jgi:hypothetical protein
MVPCEARVTEPEYRYIKGQGWVASFGPVELQGLKETELKPGDIVIGWAIDGHYQPSSVHYDITEIDGCWIRSKQTRAFHEIIGRRITFNVLRS